MMFRLRLPGPTAVCGACRMGGLAPFGFSTAPSLGIKLKHFGSFEVHVIKDQTITSRVIAACGRWA